MIAYSANRNNFASSFSIWMLFFPPCLIAIAQTISIMLNRNGEHGHPCIIPDLRGKDFDFSLSLILVVIYDFYYIGAYSFYIQFLESFNHETMLYSV